MKLQFTNGYRPRFDQISRILQYILAQEGKSRISRSEIISNLGIPDKQIENLTSMMTGFGLVNPHVSTLTPFGKYVIQSDPYFEKLETLWIIHYLVSSNPEWVVWYRVINHVLPVQDRFEVDKISNQYFSDLASIFSDRTISEKLPKEVSAVLAAYSKSEFSRLGIISQVGGGSYIKSDPKEIPDLAFLYCMVHYRENHQPGSSAINITDICLAVNSPGRVFNIPECQVRTTLDNLHDAGLIRIEQLANLDQVRLPEAVTLENILQRIYG